MKNIGFAYVIATVALFANVSVGEEVSDEADKITLTTRDKAAIEALSKIHGYSLGYFKVQPEVNFFMVMMIISSLNMTTNNTMIFMEFQET